MSARGTAPFSTMAGFSTPFSPVFIRLQVGRPRRAWRFRPTSLCFFGMVNAAPTLWSRRLTTTLFV